MKCKKVVNAFNKYVVETVKKCKGNNGQTERMPTMPISLSDASYSEPKSRMASETEATNSTTPPTIAVTTTTNVADTPSITNSERHRHNHIQHPAEQKQQQQQPIQRRVPSKTAKDYRFGKEIGQGSFSTVYLTEDIHTRKEWAIKCCSKQHMLREKKQDYVMRERNALHMLTDCPGIVKLSASFHDQHKLYFVITYAPNGDMLPYINKAGNFDLEVTKFYAAELLVALEHMHCRGVVHRDLKPENILFDERMHILITDFGSVKIFDHGIDGLCNADAPEADSVQTGKLDEAKEDSNRSRSRKNSFVGTAHYVSPEVLHNKPTGRTVDLWALGCIIYQMVSGLPPFCAPSEYLIFQQVLHRELSFPKGFDENAADLVQQLIQLDPKNRLGAQDCGKTYESIRNHPFFSGIEWDTLFEQTPPQICPFIPGLENISHRTYRIPDHIEPGLNEEQLTRLELGMDMEISEIISYHQPNNVVAIPSQPKSILDITEDEKIQRLEFQAQNNKWHAFAEDELILRQGFVNKRKGLFSRKRMLLLTTGPKLIYIDPINMVKKGEIDWSEDIRAEPKNFRIFFIHTPQRVYYLEDSEEHNAQAWCDTIDEVRKKTYNVK